MTVSIPRLVMGILQAIVDCFDLEHLPPVTFDQGAPDPQPVLLVQPPPVPKPPVLTLELAANPATVTAVQYSEAQLQARNLIEDELTLAFFNAAEQRWEPVETVIDQTTHTATAQVDHFSAWTLLDGSAPSSLYVPGLQGFQVSGFTGAASYRADAELHLRSSGAIREPIVTCTSTTRLAI